MRFSMAGLRLGFRIKCALEESRCLTASKQAITLAAKAVRRVVEFPIDKGKNIRISFTPKDCLVPHFREFHPN